MNQETIIYIILSAILLYLYYQKKDIAIFAAFAIVAGGTLIFRGSMSCEGFIEGNTGGGDKECAKLGFKPPKIQKKNWKESLVNSLKNIQKVADKHWPFEDMLDTKPKNDKAKKNFSEITNNAFYKVESAKIRDDKEKQDIQMKFIGGAAGIYEAFIISPSDEKKEKLSKDLTSEFVTKAIKGGEMVLALLKKNHEYLKKQYKAADQEMDTDVNNLSQYLICLCKQWITIWKALQKAKFGSGEDDEDEESGKKKKSKKSTKSKKSKKSKKDDEDDDEDEDEDADDE
jgi:hypothetical protein